MKFPGLVDGLGVSSGSDGLGSFVVDGRCVVEGRVPPAWVVKALNEIEDREACLGLRVEAASVEQFAIESREEPCSADRRQ